MTDGIWKEVLASVAASATLSAAFWGALGGATSALAVRVNKKAVLRQILMGALVSGGMGTAGMAIVATWLNLKPELIPLGGAGGSASYIIGVFGPALIEAMLVKIMAKPEDKDGD